MPIRDHVDPFDRRDLLDILQALERFDRRATEAIRRLRREGWEERRGKGSHLIFRRAGKRVVIANHPGDIPTGTLR